MKLRYFAAVAASVMAISSTAFAAPSANEIMEKSMEASKEVNATQMDGEMGLGMTMSMGAGTESESTMKMNVDVNYDANVTTEPLAVEMVMDMSMDAMGQSNQQSMAMYMVTEGDEAVTYSTSDGETWMKQVSEMPFSTEDIYKVADRFVNEYDFGFEVEDGTEEINGHDCYHVYTVLDGDKIVELFNVMTTIMNEELESTEAVEGTEDMLSGMEEEYGDILDAIQVGVTYYVDAETYLPVRIEVDAADTDMSVFEELAKASMGAEGAEIEISFDRIGATFDYEYEDYDIVVPTEIVDSAEEVSGDFDLETIGELAEEVESAENLDDGSFQYDPSMSSKN